MMTSDATDYRSDNATEDKAGNITEHATHYATDILSEAENGNLSKDDGFRHINNEAGSWKEDERLVTQQDYYSNLYNTVDGADRVESIKLNHGEKGDKNFVNADPCNKEKEGEHAGKLFTDLLAFRMPTWVTISKASHAKTNIPSHQLQRC
jgi:hypothetical protein